MAVFKKDIDIEYLLYKMPYRRLLELRSARVNRLIEEKKENEKLSKERERNEIGKKILAP